MMKRTLIAAIVATTFLAVAHAPLAGAAPPTPTAPPACMERYWEASAGPLTVVSRDTCSYEVRVDEDYVALESAGASAPKCVDATPPGGADMGAVYCYNVKGPCYVTATYTYVWGSETYCLVGQGAGASDVGFECMDRYWEADVGPVTIVSRNSCSYEVYYNGTSVDLTTMQASGGPNCFYRYWRQDVGDVSIVSRSTCHYEVYYQGRPLLQ